MLGSFRSEHDIRISVGSGQVSGFRHGATPCGGQEVVSSSLEASGGPGARPSRWEGASGLGPGPASAVRREVPGSGSSRPAVESASSIPAPLASTDRKSTRLNSSHVAISYSVVFLEKKII